MKGNEFKNKNLVNKKQQNEKQQKLTTDVDVKIENQTEIESEGEIGSKNDEVIFVIKIPTHSRNRLKQRIRNFFFRWPKEILIY